MATRKKEPASDVVVERTKIETFTSRRVTLTAYSGGSSIPPTSGLGLDDYSHVDVEINKGSVPREYTPYFGSDGSSRAMAVVLYRKMLERCADK